MTFSPTPSDLIRFWDKVGLVRQCWEWTGATINTGYGTFHFGTGRGSVMTAHRFAYQATYGALERGECVLHRCDNRRCVRPTHLFVGSMADNTGDMITKGRNVHLVRGDINPNRKVLEAERRLIRSRRRAGESQSSLARAFGVSRSAIYKIERESDVDG